MFVRYMVKKFKRWNDEEAFKIFDKDMMRLSYASYTTYGAAKDICNYKNSLDNTKKKDGGKYED